MAESDEQSLIEEGLMDALGAGLALMDESLRVLWCNGVFGLWFPSATGRRCGEIFGVDARGCSDCAARKALARGAPEIELTHRYDPGGRRRTFQHTFAPLTGKRLAVLTQDVTAHGERLAQLQMVQRISRAFQGVRELDELLHIILTCVTTGHASGFNRAFLFLVDKKTGTLDGKLAVGPATAEEAYTVWVELAARQHSLEDTLRDISLVDRNRLPLLPLVTGLRYPIETSRELPAHVLREGRAVLVRDARYDPRVSTGFIERFRANEYVAVPLLSMGSSVGVLIADNLYNRRPITEGDAELLEMFASPAGVAIENAAAFVELRENLDTLRETRQQLVEQTRLATVGSISAHIAHEIRNPLATIGGFARSIESKPENTDRVRANSRIIFEEALRLKRLLSTIMDFARPAQAMVARQSPNDVVLRVVNMMEFRLRPRIKVDLQLAADVPAVLMDEDQMQQVLINLIQNAEESMRTGTIRVATAKGCGGGASIMVSDDGPGIPPDLHKKVMEPFFTTKKRGTGLGLAVCAFIVTSHGGTIGLESQVGSGTTFRIVLPPEPPERSSEPVLAMDCAGS